MLNLPTPKTEAWKFTHLARAVEGIPAHDVRMATLRELEALLPVFSVPQIVLVNGNLVESLGTPLPKGIEWRDEGAGMSGPNDEALDGLDSMPVAHTWQFNITQTPARPVVVVHVGGRVGRLNMHVAAGCKANVIEVHLSVPEMLGWQHNACAIDVGAEAELKHSVLHLLPDTEHLVQTRRQRLSLAPKGVYKGALATFGGALVRSEIHTTLSEDCDYSLVSLSCPRLAQHHDVTLKTLHTGERNVVNIRQRNLQSDSSHAVFQGKFEVKQAAQKTDAYMHCHTLLLSDEARTSTKPELEIYADDVKCSHGAACGGLHPAQLFYLQARGLPEVAARALLVQGFADEFVQLFPTDVQPVLAERVSLWLAGDGPHAPILTDFSEEWLANTKAQPETRAVVREFGDEQSMGVKTP